MKRSLLLIAVAIIGFSHAQPARAQYGMGGFGNRTPLGEEIQNERKTLLSQHEKYSKPKARPAVPGASAAQSYNRGSADTIGRVDLSGRAAPRYPSVRDGSLSYSGSHYTFGSRRRTPRPTAPRLFPNAGQPRRAPR